MPIAIETGGRPMINIHEEGLQRLLRRGAGCTQTAKEHCRTDETKIEG
jgi:hypothetical protein